MYIRLHKAHAARDFPTLPLIGSRVFHRSVSDHVTGGCYSTLTLLLCQRTIVALRLTWWLVP